ncbi:hypothetical protein ACIGHG_11335 [Bacillus sp. NPDC077411]|uniref:DUF2642 domain-containing protein n=1 Tax=Bacillus bruguierae TaxID=3127667 RepID=A0ABU8FHV6_9BACI|nr:MULTISPECIES: hypothetical protein [unclassified Bacillus (in: firmicutes)]SFJ41068.1 hypothetical protein SAMN04488574_11254 [Bacillus sp. 71mf]SFT15316.1 hypothetical protein SAMN04488145_11454 [Bacillus sp. 103mf]
MKFIDALRSHVGQLAQVVLVGEAVTGIILSVTDGVVIIRTAPSYGPPEDVIVRIPIVSYVRLYS